MAIRRSIRVLSTLAAVFVGRRGQPAHADNTAPSFDTWVEIFPSFINPGTATRLDNINGSNDVNNPRQVDHWHGYVGNGAPPRWQFVNRGDSTNPYYEIRNVGSSQCRYTDGAWVVQAAR